MQALRFLTNVYVFFKYWVKKLKVKDDYEKNAHCL